MFNSPTLVLLLYKPRMNRIITLIFYVLPFLACSNHQPEGADRTDTTAAASPVTVVATDTFSRSIILPHITCLADASQSYALYIPSVFKKTLLPILCCFDPHGDGALPLQQYKTLADTFGFILIGSNNSKNGNDWNTTQTILTTLFADVQSRVVFDHNRLYTCGFSGGAKVAGYAALHQGGIKGIIVAGAGLPEEEPLRSFPFSITALAGRGDMNMTDLVALNTALDQTATVHRLILFDGKHAWPPIADMRTAFTAVQLDAMRDHTSGKNDPVIDHYIMEAKIRIAKEEADQRWPDASGTCSLAINLLMNLTPLDWFVQEQKTIQSKPAYAQQQQQTQQLLAQEEQIKQALQQQFGGGDMAYWQNTIASLQQKAKGNAPEAAMYQRLLAYLSLAFYSLSNRFITDGHNNGAAEHFVTLYKIADAANAEGWYLSAVLNARNGNVKAVETNLLKAVSLGFNDTTRFRQQPEFMSLSPLLNMDGIQSKMKK